MEEWVDNIMTPESEKRGGNSDFEASLGGSSQINRRAASEPLVKPT